MGIGHTTIPKWASVCIDSLRQCKQSDTSIRCKCFGCLCTVVGNRKNKLVNWNRKREPSLPEDSSADKGDYTLCIDSDISPVSLAIEMATPCRRSDVIRSLRPVSGRDGADTVVIGCLGV